MVDPMGPFPTMTCTDMMNLQLERGAGWNKSNALYREQCSHGAFDASRAVLSFVFTGPAGQTGPMSVPRTARERARAEIMSELLAAAHARLAADGPAGLSLRAIARDLGMASSAVYRYVGSRDELLTLLVVDGYDAVGQVAEDAATRARTAGEDSAQTWLAVARAIRSWALANRHSYELIYGTPIPGYQAPEDTVRAAMRLWAVINDVVQGAVQTGTLGAVGPDFPTRGLVTDEVYIFAGIPSADARTPELTRYIVRSLTLFSALTGAISAELFGHYQGITDDLPGLFDATIATTAAGVGLRLRLR